MKSLQITESNAKKLYLTASKEFKVTLEDTFGKSFFNLKITDRVNNFDDILEISGNYLEDIIPYKDPKNKAQKSQNALAKIQLITQVYNEGVILDWENSSIYKYTPYFIKKNGRWVFSFANYWCTYAYFGFGGYYISNELAVDAGSKFIDIYSDFLPE